MDDSPQTPPAAHPDQGSICVQCGCSLAGLSNSGTCPECGTAYTPAGAVHDDRPCLRCGYSLTGLSESGNCPECGAPVRSSLRGPLLECSAPEYVASLHHGVILIEAGIALKIISSVAMFAAAISFGIARAGGPPPWFYWWNHTGSVALNLLSLAGWWMLSMPDPAFAGRDPGTTARKVLRATLVISFAASVGSMVTTVWGGHRLPSAGQAGVSGPIDVIMVLVFLVQLGAGLAWIVQFFAAMKYLQWLGPRLPDRTIVERATKFMWLLPLIYVVGAICLGLGPLIALVMYVSLLDRLRSGLAAVRARIAVETSQSL